MTTTYILAGQDVNGAFTNEMAIWETYAKTHSDLIILRPQTHETMAQTVSRIEGPANIILATHGNEDGGFRWTKGERPSYGELFAALPRSGVQSITIESCYGELAQNDKNALPSGTLLQSVVGAKVEALGGTISGSMVKEIVASEITPLHIMLTALNHTEPDQYKLLQDEADRAMQKHPKRAHKHAPSIIPLNPDDVLPHLISIGGKPPVSIDLNDEMTTIALAVKHGALNMDAFHSAIAMVKEHFHAVDHAAIDALGEKLAAGANPRSFTPNEKRIGYAITLADMYANGTMERDIQRSEQISPALWDGKGSETVAKIQAVLSHVMTSDTTGNDDHVSGLITPKMLAALATVRAVPDISTPQSQQAMLDELLHTQSVKDIFGTIRDAHGEQIANITLQRAQAPAHER